MSQNHAQYEQWALQQLALEEDFYGSARRGTNRIDPLTGELAKSEPAHQPFDLQAASTDNPVIQGAQGYRVAVHMLMLYNAGDQQDVTLKDGVGGISLTGPLTALPSQVGLMLPWSDVPYFTLSPGNAFVITSGAAASPRLTGFIKYRLLEGGPS